MSTVRRGDTFTHNSVLDPDWTPGPGQTYRRNSPHALMVVTAIRQGTVYFRYAHYRNVSGWCTDLATFEARYSAQCIESRKEAHS